MATKFRIEEERPVRIRKSWFLAGTLSLFFVILLLRLLMLQVFMAETNIRLSKENQMRLRTLKAPRGRILDRNGVVLARNRPSYSISVLPYQVKSRPEVIRNLLKVRDSVGLPIFDSLELAERIQRARYRRFDLTRLKEDISMDIVSVVEEHSMELQGIVVQTEARREYPMGPTSFHVLGYVGEIPEEDFDSLRTQGYLYGDVLGKAGMEKQYENTFRGKDGREYIEVNAYGKSLGRIENMPSSKPVPGKDVYLSIDSRLQDAAAEAFPDSLKGAVVAIDPRNGEILVMYSSPSLDANIFSMAGKVRSKGWAAAALDSNRPLNNRAVVGTYPPGSTFKLVTAVAGMEQGASNGLSTMPVPCNGAYRFGNMVKRCWYSRGHGGLNLISAVKVSCNVYFYQLGLRLGDQAIIDYSEMFGLGQKTGVDYPHEAAGYLSGEKHHNQRFGKRIEHNPAWSWTRGLVLDMAIGQSQVFTPLQLALMVGGMGNGKALYRPRLMKEIRSHDGIMLQQSNPEILHPLHLDSTTQASIHEAMEDVILPGGTGGRARVSGIPVGGKTGSAENPHGKDTHGLFVGCAPVDNPVIAIAAVVENAGHGGSVAAPIAGHVLRYFFAQTPEGKQIVDEYSDREERRVQHR